MSLPTLIERFVSAALASRGLTYCRLTYDCLQHFVWQACKPTRLSLKPASLCPNCKSLSLFQRFIKKFYAVSFISFFTQRHVRFDVSQQDVVDLGRLASKNAEYERTLAKTGLSILKAHLLNPADRATLFELGSKLHADKCTAVEQAGGNKDAVLRPWESVFRPGREVLNRDRTDYKKDKKDEYRLNMERILRYPTNSLSSFHKYGSDPAENLICHTFIVLNNRDHISLQSIVDACNVIVIIQVSF